MMYPKEGGGPLNTQLKKGVLELCVLELLKEGQIRL